MEELTRKKILEGDYKYPQELVKLVKTVHFRERLEERGIGLECFPSMVRVTKKNIHSAKTDDGEHLISVVVRLDYTSSKYIFICFNPYDGYCKTVWFQTKKYEGRRK